MNDHQDSEHFSYERTWEDIENLLNESEREQNRCLTTLRDCPRPLRVSVMKRYKGLEGVINALRWVLGDLRMSKNKVLGKEK
tara:strand:+ start:1038 stop:1283 length:246 start_codon:yes stop_codon:yes gene_type:complete